VIGVTAFMFITFQNRHQEDFMPILMVALIALGAFGLIGLMLALAVTLEQRKVAGKQPGSGKA
jgi:hypothetical protein